MKAFLRYLKSKRTVIIAFLIFASLFALSFALFDLPLGAVVYPSLLCVLVGAVFLALDYIKVKKLRSELEFITRMRSDTMGELPEVVGIQEEEYQKIIENLRLELSQVRESDFRSYREMIDYYTVWAHQIKTPIAAMKLVLQKSDTEESRTLLSDLFKIEQYVEMVLTYLRLDSDQSDYLFRVCPLDDIVRSAVRKFAHEFISRSISLSFEESGESVLCDEKWLSFVIEQLLSNALKYTKEGGSIRIYSPSAKTLCVSDTGIGIAPGDLPRIFERGFTGYNGRNDKSATGIGLYLCRRVCDNIGIKIKASSQLGEGTCVTLDLSKTDVRAE